MRKAVERAMRAIAALPEDDWQPEHHDAFEAARAVIVDELGRLDRQKARRQPKWKPDPPELIQARKVVQERSGGLCEARTPVCDHVAVHVHHKAGRKGAGAHRPERLLHVCAACHDHIHANPEEAYMFGWMLRRLGAV